MLEGAGFEVAEAAGEQAVRAFRDSGADVVLCDMFMPDVDGLEVIRELRRDFPKATVIAMSGGGYGGSLDVLPVARQLGAAGVLYKPFGPAALLAAIDRVRPTCAAG
jgi:CheY-like chemotaxis protein